MGGINTDEPVTNAEVLRVISLSVCLSCLRVFLHVSVCLSVILLVVCFYRSSCLKRTHCVALMLTPNTSPLKIATKRFMVTLCNIRCGKQRIKQWTILIYEQVFKSGINNKMAASRQNVKHLII